MISGKLVQELVKDYKKMKKALTNDRPFTIIKTTKEQRTKRI